MGGGNTFIAEKMKNNSHIVASGGDETDRNVLPSEKIVPSVNDNEKSSETCTLPPLFSSYNDVVRPLLDALHPLHCIDVIEEGITFPTIVVIGERSSGKSSVIESLTGISFPRGDGRQGVGTQVPLMIKFQYHPDPVSKLRLEYQGKPLVSFNNKADISKEINIATDKINKNEIEILKVPLTLVVKVNTVATDLTILDLPGLPNATTYQNAIVQFCADIIVGYIKPEECLILNVIPSMTDLKNCESLKMSRKFDEIGQRTIHVVTKVDYKVTEDQLTIITTNKGPNYVCVRNRLGDETYQEARTKEAKLFETHHLLSKIHKSMIGIHVVARNLVFVQLVMITKHLDKINMKIKEELNTCVKEQAGLESQFTTTSEAMSTLREIITMSQKSFFKNVIPRERLNEMTQEFSDKLMENRLGLNRHDQPLNVEIQLLRECMGVISPTYHPETVFNILLEREIDKIRETTDSCVSRIWNYIEDVMVKVLVLHAEYYPQLLLVAKAATKNVIAILKEKFKCKLFEFFEMKKMEDYKSDPEVISSWGRQYNNRQYLKDKAKNSKVSGSEGGEMTILDHAIDIRTKRVAYWDIVRKRFIEMMESSLESTVNKMAVKEMEIELMNEMKNGDEDRYKRIMMAPPILITTKIWKLKNRIELLNNSKKVIENTMDKVVSHGY